MLKNVILFVIIYKIMEIWGFLSFFDKSFSPLFATYVDVANFNKNKGTAKKQNNRKDRTD